MGLSATAPLVPKAVRTAAVTGRGEDFKLLAGAEGVMPTMWGLYCENALHVDHLHGIYKGVIGSR